MELRGELYQRIVEQSVSGGIDKISEYIYPPITPKQVQFTRNYRIALRSIGAEVYETDSELPPAEALFYEHHSIPSMSTPMSPSHTPCVRTCDA